MRKPGKRFWVVLAICAACTTLGVWLTARGYIPLLELELYTEDVRARFGRKTPVDPRLVLIGIDRPVYSPSDFSEADLQATPVLRELQAQFPWSRAVWTELTEKLSAAGAKVIVFDLIFRAPTE